MAHGSDYKETHVVWCRPGPDQSNSCFQLNSEHKIDFLKIEQLSRGDELLKNIENVIHFITF